jgi:hypothetical protein
LDIPLTHDEIDRVQALWAPASVRSIIFKTTLPVIDGNETIATGYDLLNSVSVNEPIRLESFKVRRMCRVIVRYPCGSLNLFGGYDCAASSAACLLEGKPFAG